MGEFLSTREAARLLAVGTSTVKRWADDGVLYCVKTRGGHRRFRKRDVELLRHEQAEQKGGEAELDQWMSVLVSDLAEQSVAAKLLQERARLGAWWSTADHLGAVLDELGNRWARGALTIVEEHVASERLARGLALVGQTLVTADDSPVVLLMTAAMDEHTLGLSLAELVAKEAGWRALWVGRKAPIDALRDNLGQTRLKMIALSASPSCDDVLVLAAQLEALAPWARKHDVEIVLGGRGAWPEPPTVGHRLHTFSEFHGLLDKVRERS